MSSISRAGWSSSAARSRRSCAAPICRRKRRQSWHGVTAPPIWSPRVTGVEALVHSFLGVLQAAREPPDILHIHSIGPALFAPLARALGLRVVVTHHVLNYENEKWGRGSRALLRLGERVGMTFSQWPHRGVALPRRARERRLSRSRSDVIPNGIGELSERPDRTRCSQQFGLTPGRYLLTVARIDPQKCQLDLIAAFRQAQPTDWKLALAGGADYAAAMPARWTKPRSDARRRHARPSRGKSRSRSSTPTPAHLCCRRATKATDRRDRGARLWLPRGPQRHSAPSRNRREPARYFAPAMLRRWPSNCARPATIRRAKAAVVEHERILRAHDWARIAESTLEVYRAALRRSGSGQGGPYTRASRTLGVRRRTAIAGPRPPGNRDRSGKARRKRPRPRDASH